MSYQTIPRYGLLLALLPVVLASKEEGAFCLLQLDVKAKREPWSMMSTLSTVIYESNSTSSEQHRMSQHHMSAEKLLENSAVLHMPYAQYAASHVAMNVTYNGLGEQITTFPQRRPFEFNVILATLKTTTADAVVQFSERRPGQSWRFDWSRSFTFALFGLVYIGITQWYLYVTILSWLFPGAMAFANEDLSVKLEDQTGMIDMVGQIGVDCFIFAALIYFPVFYTFKSLIQGKGTLISRLQTGLEKYWTNVIPDNIASFAVWVPADVVIFACPMYLRMPMEHAVSFGWTMFISATRGAGDSKADQKADPKLYENSSLIPSASSAVCTAS